MDIVHRRLCPARDLFHPTQETTARRFVVPSPRMIPCLPAFGYPLRKEGMYVLTEGLVRCVEVCEEADEGEEGEEDGKGAVACGYEG